MNPLLSKSDIKLWKSGFFRFHDLIIGSQTLLCLIFDLLNNASIFADTTKKESAGTREAVWGIGLLKAVLDSIKTKNEKYAICFLKKMEIVIFIPSNYFATQKGQIIFPFFKFSYQINITYKSNVYRNRRECRKGCFLN